MSERKIMHGNEAAAWGALLSRIQAFSVYPITPQTTIPEKLAEFAAKGLLKAESDDVESEASAAAWAMGASLGGARAFTATSSQGLWLMAEQIYSAGVQRLPLVMVNVNRTLGPPFNILLSHEDSLALRDIPWLQFYAATAQEVLDSVIIGYKVAEKVYLPVMVNLDGFYLSHASELVEVPSQELVDKFLPPYKPLYPIDFEKPIVFNPSIDDDYLTEFRYILMKEMKKAKRVVNEAHAEFHDMFGRKYESIEKYKMENARMAIVALGSVAGTIKSTLKDIDGVGLIRIRTFRPFPKEELREALAGVERVAVLDRAMQGIVARELNEVLPRQGQPDVISFIAGLGGRDIPPKTVLETIERMKKGPLEEPVWIDLKTNGDNPFNSKSYPAVGFWRSKETILPEIPSEEPMSPGEFACQGCGQTLTSRLVMKALGPRTFEVRTASCSSVTNGRFPNCASLYPLQNVCFGEAAAVACGVRAGFDATQRKNVNVLAFAGDGGTYDIGLQALSGAAERNSRNVICVCYDNQAYMNTGIQRSGATPFGSWTSTTPAGKRQFRKDMMAIMAAHRIPYCATASIAYPEDLIRKVERAKSIKGCKFILVFSSCPTGWRFPTEKMIEIARLAVETRVWPLYEIFDGEKYVINQMPDQKPVAVYLKPQGRFDALEEADYEVIQENVDKEWLKLKQKALQ